MEKAEEEVLLKWCRDQINRVADFHFMGTPSHHMRFEVVPEKSVIYHIYALGGAEPIEPREVVRALTDRMVRAIDAVDGSPLCIVWRRYPDLTEYTREDVGLIHKCSLRLSVMDQDLNQVGLAVLNTEDGSPPPLL